MTLVPAFISMVSPGLYILSVRLDLMSYQLQSGPPIDNRSSNVHFQALDISIKITHCVKFIGSNEIFVIYFHVTMEQIWFGIVMNNIFYTLFKVANTQTYAPNS